jgi:hypothetical protein
MRCRMIIEDCPTTSSLYIQTYNNFVTQREKNVEQQARHYVGHIVLACM